MLINSLCKNINNTLTILSAIFWKCTRLLFEKNRLPPGLPANSKIRL